MRQKLDIHEIASSGRLDWQSVMKKADEFEAGLAVRQTLAVCSRLLGNYSTGILFFSLPA
jgi:hypothetical protein